MSARDVVIGVDIGGTKIAAHLSDGTDWQDSPLEIRCPATEGGAAILAAVIELCRGLVAHADEAGDRLRAVGVGSAGQIDAERGVVIDANPNLRDWRGADIAGTLRAALGLPVYVDNDVRTMALAERDLGAARPYADCLFVAVGTGIGGAILRDGELYHGLHYAGGEIGYLLGGHDADGTPRTVESLASGPALEREYQRLAAGASSDPARLPLHEIAGLASAGDAVARAVIEAGARRLADVLAPVLVLLDPAALIVGGGVPQIGDLWWRPLTETIRAHPMRVLSKIDIMPAHLGASAVLFGASCLAWRRYHEETNT